MSEVSCTVCRCRSVEWWRIAMSVSTATHEPSSSRSTTPSSPPAAAARHRPVTDHSVEFLLQSSSSTSTVDQPCISFTSHHVRTLSHAAALMPSADEALSPPACHPSYHGADVTECDVTDCAVNVQLEHKALWDRFNTLGTEMVITKSGR